MASYSVRALVLRKTKLGETDVIVTLLAQDGRQLRAVAKGMRKPGSRFGGRLEPFCVVDLLLHAGRSLEVVTEAETVNSFAPLREDFDRSTAASVLVDVLDKTAQEGQTEERVFAMAEATLAVMADAPVPALPAIVSGFLAKALAMQGYRPELLACACCAQEATGGRVFSLQAGGVLCPECGEADASTVAFTQEARDVLGALLRMTMREIAQEPFDAAALRDCFSLLRAFAAYHLPARLKALDFYAGSVFT